MNRFSRMALGAMLLAGATAVTTAPADARVTIGIGIGVPGGYYYGGGPRYNAYCDPYSPYYDPYDCSDYGPVGYWYNPIFIDGVWVRGPFRWRWDHGRRVFWVNGGWRGDGWGGGDRPDFRRWHDGDWHDHDFRREWRGDGDRHDRGGDWHDHDHGDHDHWHH